MISINRTQFTFYSSFARAISHIRKKADRADAYDAIVNYALYGIDPDLKSLPDSVAIAFDLAKPNLDSSRKKAEGGKKSGKNSGKTEGTSGEDSGKIPATSGEDADNKKEEEKENKKEIENECYLAPACELKAPGSLFTNFWDAYPNRINREDAWKAWKELNPDADLIGKIMSGLDAWKASRKWTEDDGDFVPAAAKWLKDRRWEITPPVASSGKKDIPKGASGQLGQAELDAIARVMAQPLEDCGEQNGL